ncbi:MAG: DUF1450 domain-containing protein [Bacilli bacterium]|jgi:uncharacterized protein YuzB (UPF0349 family)
MNIYKMCDICNGEYTDQLQEEILKLDSTAQFELGCQNLCAIGAVSAFVLMNGMLIKGETVEEIIEQIKERL